MNLIMGFSRNYTSTVIQIAEKCELYIKVEEKSS